MSGRSLPSFVCASDSAEAAPVRQAALQVEEERAQVGALKHRTEKWTHFSAESDAQTKDGSDRPDMAGRLSLQGSQPVGEKVQLG